MLHVKATLREEIKRLEKYLETETNKSIEKDIKGQINEHKNAIELLQGENLTLIATGIEQVLDAIVIFMKENNTTEKKHQIREASKRMISVLEGYICKFMSEHEAMNAREFRENIWM